MQRNVKFVIRISLCVFLWSSAPIWASSDLPLGLWSWCTGTEHIQYNVEISRDGEQWKMRAGDQTIMSTGATTPLSFTLKNGISFSVNSVNQTALTGIWNQPEQTRFGYYAKMATITTFAASKSNTWAGTVTLQSRPFHLFLELFQDESGATKAAIRNPERNDILGATQFSVERKRAAFKNKRWQLKATRGEREIKIPVTYRDDTINLDHDQLPPIVRFTQNNDCDAGKYYSRDPDVARHLLSTVKQLDDGWQVVDPKKAGFDADKLNAMVQHLATSQPRERRPQLMHSLLVSHKSKLIVEEYFYGHTRETRHDTRSLAKVFGSILIGAAQQQGFDIDADYAPLSLVAKEHDLDMPLSKQSIGLSYFMTYSSGLDMAETDASQGSEDRLWQQREEDFWLYSTKLPVLHPPGKRYAYASASANMVGAAITQVTSQTSHDFFHEYIAKPLGFDDYHWNLTPNNIPYLGGGVYIKPRDILKLGAMYAANGKWQGKQIVPAAWIAESTQTHMDISAETTGLSQTEFDNNYSAGGQGYIWFVSDISANDTTYTTYAATGNGGQMLVVVPKLELAVVFTGGNYRMGAIWGRWRQQIIGDYLIPALKTDTAK